MKKFECKRCGRCCIHSIPEFERDEYLRVKDKAEAMGIKFIGLRLLGEDTYYTSKTFDNLKNYLPILTAE